MIWAMPVFLGLLASGWLLVLANRTHKKTTELMRAIHSELKVLEAARLKATLEQDAERLIVLPSGMVGYASEYETRDDGKLMRKDRWKTGIGNIVTILIGSRTGYEIDDIVEKVRVIAKVARADYESGGDGTPGSAPVWGPCHCNEGLIASNLECPDCQGRGKVIIEKGTASQD